MYKSVKSIVDVIEEWYNLDDFAPKSDGTHPSVNIQQSASPSKKSKPAVVASRSRELTPPPPAQPHTTATTSAVVVNANEPADVNAVTTTVVAAQVQADKRKTTPQRQALNKPKVTESEMVAEAPKAPEPTVRKVPEKTPQNVLEQPKESRRIRDSFAGVCVVCIIIVIIRNQSPLQHQYQHHCDQVQHHH